MKDSILNRALVILVVVGVALAWPYYKAIEGQTSYTLNLADGTILRPNIQRGGVNIASMTYYDNGQISKNLIGQSNPGFEPVQSNQYWKLNGTGTFSRTQFSNTNKYAVYVANIWAGASFTVTESSGAELGCTGTIASNTTGVGGSTAAVYTINSTTNQGTSGCAAAFAFGDQIHIYQSQFPTPESIWESGGNNMWANLSNGGKLLTDSSTPYDGAQSMLLDVTAGSSALAGVNFYFDTFNINHFIVLNGQYQVCAWAKYGNSVTGNKISFAAGRSGAQQTQTFAITASWAHYCTTPMTFSETNTNTGNGLLSIYTLGSQGLGQVDVDDVTFQKTSGQDSTNTTIFRDEYVHSLQQYFAASSGGPKGFLRNWLNQNGENMTNWTKPFLASAQTIAGGGWTNYGEVTPRLYDYLNLAKTVNALPYLEVPVTFSTTDAAALVEYLSSTNTTSGWGQVRANQGQSAPWVGPTGVFPVIYLSFCNECWNDSSFNGQDIPYNTGDSSYYIGLGTRAGHVYAAMRGSPSFSTAIRLGLNMQIGVNYAPGGIDVALQKMASEGGEADYVEQAPYFGDTISNWQTDAALWGSAFVEPWANTTNPSSSSRFLPAVQAIQGYNYCGASGTAPCEATVYEQGPNQLTTCGVAGWPACTGGNNQAITQPVEDHAAAGAAEAIIIAYQEALNQRQLGIVAQNDFGSTEFQNSTLGGLTAKLWGNSVDYGGAPSYLNGLEFTPRPTYMGPAVLHSAEIGPEYACSFTSGPTQNWPGDPLNGPTTAQANVPLMDAFCYTNGSQRGIVIFNTTLTTSYNVNFAGTNTPSGTCSQQQYAPSSPDLMNEPASGTTINNTAATTAIAISSGTCPSSLSVPPDSITAIVYTAGGIAPVSTPTFSPGAGTYTSTQSVVLASATSGATVCWKIGSAPSATTAGSCDAGSTPYSSPISVSTTETIFAIGTKAGLANSSVSSALYTISLPTAATPTFSPAAGTYGSTQSVSLATTTGGASIYYTTDGSTPTTGSTLYTGPISVAVTTTIKAIAVPSGPGLNSPVGTATYTISIAPVATPVFTPAAGVYTSPQTVSITSATGGAVIHYTLDGSTPTSGSPVYSSPLSIGAGTTTVKAIAISGGVSSSVASGVYTINLPTVTTPTFSPAAGTFSSTQTVSISTSPGSASIYYTLDGSTPTPSSTLYTGPITISITTTVSAIATAPGYNNSAVGVATYTILTVALPTFSPNGGTNLTAPVAVTIATTTSGAGICFTQDGTAPIPNGSGGCSNGTLYSGVITVSAGETLKAVAFKSGSPNSSVAVSNPFVFLGLPGIRQYGNGVLHGNGKSHS